jgi:hypothetical protein
LGFTGSPFSQTAGSTGFFSVDIYCFEPLDERRSLWLGFASCEPRDGQFTNGQGDGMFDSEVLRDLGLDHPDHQLTDDKTA